MRVEGGQSQAVGKQPNENKQKTAEERPVGKPKRQTHRNTYLYIIFRFRRWRQLPAVAHIARGIVRHGVDYDAVRMCGVYKNNKNDKDDDDDSLTKR
ncbi:unnamed protein product, partial [Ceratitis capitata]